MKQFILLMVLIGLLLLASEIEQTTIQVLIVIPLEWEPYLDWWLNFPGLHPPQKQPTNPPNMKFDFLQAEYARIGIRNTAKFTDYDHQFPYSVPCSVDTQPKVDRNQ